MKMPFCVDCFTFDLMPTIAILVTFAPISVPVLLHAGAPARSNFIELASYS